MGLVFTAAADETERGDQTGPFLFGGWVAPVLDWQNTVAPLWEERVLNGRPVLPYFHITELLSRQGRAKYGLTQRQAEVRIDKAIGVIRRVPSLVPVWAYVDGGHFRSTFKETQLIRAAVKQPGVFAMEPDYIGFNGFAIGALTYVATKFPNAEKVDFLVERKGKVTRRIEAEFFSKLPEALRAKNLDHLVRLIGTFIPGEKDRVPLQVADLFLWYARVGKSKNATREERHRFRRLVEGREGVNTGMSREDVSDLGVRSKAQNVPSPFRPKPKRVVVA